ncbi:aldo/keto reductase [Intestinibacter sp.]|uniref:aldo/keto reductase n=1 Tax=Intestinibacter sp. TaxID=1965304 RepID=UPI00307DA115
MKYTTLGKSDLKVSRICLGCMGFGDTQKGMHSWTLPYEQSKEIVKYALESGINFFDTAMGYQGGTSEEYLGRIIKECANREDVIVATKFVPRTESEIKNNISGQQHVENCLDASLKRLQMDYVDLYVYHFWDYNTPIEDIMEGLHNVVKQGKARYIGISNCYAYQLAKANAIARQNGWEEFISIQGHYNLIFREEEREMVPLCKEENIALTPYSSLASGRLSKHPGEESKRMREDSFAKGKYDSTADADLKIIHRVEEIAQIRGVSMSEVSLAWLIKKTTSPTVGATKKHHIDTAVKAVELELTDEEMKYLEELYVPHELVGVMAQNK